MDSKRTLSFILWSDQLRKTGEEKRYDQDNLKKDLWISRYRVLLSQNHGSKRNALLRLFFAVGTQKEQPLLPCDFCESISPSLQVRVFSSFITDCRCRSVTGENPYIILQLQNPITAFDQGGVVPARQVRSPDRSGEEGVSGEDEPPFPVVVGAPTGGMAGRGDDGQQRVLKVLSVDKIVIGLGEVFERFFMNGEEAAIKDGCFDDFIIEAFRVLFAQENFHIRIVLLEAGQRSDMVIVGMRQQSAPGSKTQRGQFIDDQLSIGSRIDYPGTLRLPTPEDVAVCLIFTNNQSSENHHYSRLE